MGRKPRQGSSTGLYHVITRGNNKTLLFHGKKDFDEYLQIVKEYLAKHPIKIHHYCLMSNHTHMLAWTEEIQVLARFMHGIQRSYHHYYRKNHTWFGHLFQGRYKSLGIEDEAHMLDCGRYIERNPVRAKMVTNPQDWKYSSYRVYAYGEKDDMITASAVYQGLAIQVKDRQELYRRHVELTRPYEEIIDKKLIGA